MGDRVRERALLLARYARGDRLDDVLRGPLTIAEGLWEIIELVRSREQKQAAPTATPSFPAAPTVEDRRGPLGASLPDLSLVAELLDWEAMRTIIAARGFEPDLRRFQSFDTFDTLRRRLAILHAYDDLVGRSLVLLGDDELFGLTLALTDLVPTTTIIDVDARIVAREADEARRRSLRLVAHRADVLLEDLPAIEADTFFISGLKDAGGLRAFISAGLLCTRARGGVGYVSVDLDVYDPDSTIRANMRSLLKMFERLDCHVTAVLPCDELALSTELLEHFEMTIQRCAESGATFDEMGAELTELASAGLDLFTGKHGFPHIRLEPALLVRVVPGDDSRRLASRERRLLRSFATRGPTRGAGAVQHGV